MKDLTIKEINLIWENVKLEIYRLNSKIEELETIMSIYENEYESEERRTTANILKYLKETKKEFTEIDRKLGE